MWQTDKQISRRMVLRVGVGTSAAIVLGDVLAACGASSTAGTSGPSKAHPFKATLAVSHLKDIVAQAPLIVGMQNGAYQNAGLDIQAISFTGGGDTMRAITTGTAQWGIPASVDPIVAIANGEKLKIIAGQCGNADIGFLVPTNSSLRTIQDVIGKKVGYSNPGSASQFLAAQSVHNAGLDVTQVHFISIGGLPASWTAAKTGVIDVAWSSEPFMSKIVATGQARVLWRAPQYVPNFLETVVSASDGFIQNNAAVLRSFVSVHQQMCAFVNNNLEQAAALWAKGVGISTELALSALKGLPPGSFSTALPTSGLALVGSSLVQLKLIAKLPAWNQIVDEQFIPTGLQQPLPS